MSKTWSIKRTAQRVRLLALVSRKLGTEGITETLDGLITYYLENEGARSYGR